MNAATASSFSLQSLPPQAAKFCLAMERFCRDELECGLRGISVLVAFSGGADSLALLLALRALSARLGLTLGAAMLDHGLRPESGAEASAAAGLCASLGVRFYSRRADVGALAAERACGLEEAGREARLAFLETVRADGGYDWIAFGHQLNDLAEDSLMRLLRGAGWPSLAGMRGIDHDRRVIRPLLLTPRAAIEDFLRTLGRDWTDDPLNRDQAFLRNRMRGRMLPLLLEENPAFLDTVALRWRVARDDAAFFAASSEIFTMAGDAGTIFFHRETLTGAPRALRLRAYKAALERLGPGQILGSALMALDRAWKKGEGGKTVQFSGRKTACIRNGGIVFSADPD